MFQWFVLCTPQSNQSFMGKVIIISFIIIFKSQKCSVCSFKTFCLTLTPQTSHPDITVYVGILLCFTVNGCSRTCLPCVSFLVCAYVHLIVSPFQHGQWVPTQTFQNMFNKARKVNDYLIDDISTEW